MSTAYGRRAAGKRRAGQREQSGRGARRRLVQLVVSLVLFLLVFLGHGVFPAGAESWKEALSESTDFSAVFRQFEQDLSGKKTLGQSLKRLFLSAAGVMLPGEPEEQTPAESEDSERPSVVLLGNTEDRGLAYLRQYGVGRQRESPPESPVESARPEVVTAVAQTYAADGTALPSNVSFAWYELGLPETVTPVEGTASSGFGYRISPITGKREFHLALDIVADQGTEIRAFADGVVAYIGESDEFGLYFKINHDNGVSTFYAHCSKLLVHKGDAVACGQTVALVGSTGNATGAHLHLTIEKDNIRLDPAYYVEVS